MKPRENPFRMDRLETLLQFDPALMGSSWKEIFHRCEQAGWRGAVVGPHGVGKTTFLEGLETRLLGRGMRVCLMRLNSSASNWDHGEWAELERSVRQGAIILVDGAEQLRLFSWLRLRWLARKAAGLIITTHFSRRLKPLFQFTGEKVTALTLASRLAGHKPLSDSQLETAWQAGGGNLRNFFRTCYEMCAAESANS